MRARVHVCMHYLYVMLWNSDFIFNTKVTEGETNMLTMSYPWFALELQQELERKTPGDINPVNWIETELFFNNRILK